MMTLMIQSVIVNQRIRVGVIIDILAEEQIPSPRGSERWSKKSVETILTNIKYTGNVEALKSSPTKDRYLLEDAHKPIVTLDQFAEAQEEMERRARRKRRTENLNKSLIDALRRGY